jgi:predicted transcriptional regulator|tara:strand:- start:416 stop:688 length:273 start_codon:yes stop_codon:yes gene_type:complete
MEKKRNRTDILNDMLRILKDGRGRIKRTHLMYKANLSHKQLKLYLDELEKNKLIENNSEEKTTLISITKKGMDFTIKYSQMKEFEKTFGL